MIQQQGTSFIEADRQRTLLLSYSDVVTPVKKVMHNVQVGQLTSNHGSSVRKGAVSGGPGPGGFPSLYR